MASSEVAAHAHFAILSCDVMGTDSGEHVPFDKSLSLAYMKVG